MASHESHYQRYLPKCTHNRTGVTVYDKIRAGTLHTVMDTGGTRAWGWAVDASCPSQVQSFLLFITTYYGTNYFTTDKPSSPVVSEMAFPNSRKPPRPSPINHAPQLPKSSVRSHFRPLWASCGCCNSHHLSTTPHNRRN